MDLCREIEKRGVRYLTDSQLLAVVLGAGSRMVRFPGFPDEIIDTAGGMERLSELSFHELCGVQGVGPAGASAVLAAIEIGRRALSGIFPGVRLSSSSAVYETFWPLMATERIEIFSCALLDAKLRLISAEVISKGILNASIVHPREAFRPAIRNAASGVIFIHNHPSGDSGPSEDDRAITDRLSKVGEIMGIPLLDHVIIGTIGSYYSFADAGELSAPEMNYKSMSFE
ncbi:MAG: DNA repair protein RadC [Actinobacteria bacterium]|nr:DNA repair protein RadC [Actinomycetota bacterium]